MAQRTVWAILLFGALSGTAFAQGQQPAVDLTARTQSDQKPASAANAPQAPTDDVDKRSTTVKEEIKDDDEGKQSKRILWIFPNYRAVNVSAQLPPLSVKEKLWLATLDSFDYSSFITAGILAGISQANKSEPEFGQGAKGYGRYYWHTVADQAVGNYMTETIMPVVTREDPRYYTLGHGGFFKRTGYAVSRLFVTRTDAGGRTFNFSEIVGNGAGAGISDAYYPGRDRTFTKTYQKWGTQIALDGVFNIVKEFWPDINHSVFHGKY